MPFKHPGKKRSANDAFWANVATEMKHGKPKRQAEAIAASVERAWAAQRGGPRDGASRKRGKR